MRITSFFFFFSAWMLSLILLVACSDSGGSSNHPVGDTDADESALSEMDEEEEESAPATCLTEGCTGGKICDETLVECRDCQTHDECAASLDGEGFAVCEEGVCVRYSCPAAELPETFPIAAPYGGWPNPRLDAERQLVVQYLDRATRLFPLGIEGLPMSMVSEARDAGFTFLSANTPCCGVESLEEQLDYMRQGNTDGLYVVLKPFDPPWQVEDPYDAAVLQALSDRTSTDSQSLLAWLGFENPSVIFRNRDDFPSYFEKMRDAVYEIDDAQKRPMAVSDLPSTGLAQRAPDAAILWPTLPADPVEAFAELRTMRSDLPDTAIWARLPVVPQEWIDCLKDDACPPAQTGAGVDAETLKLLGMTAFAAGADGLVMWGYEYAAYTLDDHNARWGQVKALATWFQARSGVWMAGKPTQAATIDNANVGLFQRQTDKLHYLYLVNPGTSSAETALSLPGSDELRCVAGVNGEDMELTAETVQNVALQAGEIRLVMLGTPRRVESR